jgi:protein-disulfide isomerase
VNNKINADIAAFKATGQQESTPSFFINGKNYPNTKFVDASGTPSVDAFSKVIDEALKNAK